VVAQHRQPDDEPLRPFEFITALMVMSLVRLSIGAVPVTFLAIAFFGFNLYASVWRWWRSSST